jgi:hypothetical protein
VAGCAANPGADHLHRRHQRIGGEDCPAHAEAEPGSGLAVSSNAARIVVRGAGDQAGADDLAQPQPLRGASVNSAIESAPAMWRLNLAHAEAFRRLAILPPISLVKNAHSNAARIASSLRSALTEWPPSRYSWK